MYHSGPGINDSIAYHSSLPFLFHLHRFTDRVETRITAHLRDQLGTAKNANEMFRIFSRFNALFVRPHIRGAIREYQTQLIQRVKDDIEALHEKFKVTTFCIRKNTQKLFFWDLLMFRHASFLKVVFNSDIFICVVCRSNTHSLNAAGYPLYVICHLSLVLSSGLSRLITNLLLIWKEWKTCWVRNTSATLLVVYFCGYF